jgi:putative SOS response-associated peptidase YedK
MGKAADDGARLNLRRCRACGLYRIEESYPVFVILTKEPTAELSKIHDRMPLMLPKDRIDEWISPRSNPEEIVPFALSDMVMEKAED